MSDVTKVQRKHVEYTLWGPGWVIEMLVGVGLVAGLGFCILNAINLGTIGFGVGLMVYGWGCFVFKEARKIAYIQQYNDTVTALAFLTSAGVIMYLLRHAEHSDDVDKDKLEKAKEVSVGLEQNGKLLLEELNHHAVQGL